MIDRLTDKELDREKLRLESFEEALKNLYSDTPASILDSSYVQQKWKVVGDRKYLSPIIRGALQHREKLLKWIAESHSKITAEEHWRKMDKSSQQT